ncbi:MULTISPECIES: allophanate hydrolase [Methylomicrobium]|uniref:Allophanate hydrolase n=1 Tax=Methylomicrobium album BG8 TaxID=686340 RepID=H8GP13_METAL|nr:MULTISPECIES: allophanate hydrolase [Methylomicrobium]EIC28435.1 allophanate hydrolase [Methylomicrobium album BG8]
MAIPYELPLALDMAALRQAYMDRLLTPTGLVERLWQRLEHIPNDGVWISRLSREDLIGYAAALERKSPDELPLYGIPFAIKDNIDLAGLETTAACPSFAYRPEKSAFVVQRLIAAGAIPIGKTNLDQFATGLVGTRSPYGICRNAFDADYIAGGSSSGSAVAVAKGLVSFALGTDTAGSGRVPAAFNNLVGVKPSRGLLSASGVVPACQSLDCVSIFALSAQDAERVLQVAQAYDRLDLYARPDDPRPMWPGFPDTFRFGVPESGQLAFFGDQDARALFYQAVDELSELGGEAVAVDFEPFLEAAKLLYNGPWVAERYGVVRKMLDRDPDALWPVTREIIAAGAELSMADAWKAFHRLQILKRQADSLWKQADVLLTPTTGTIYRIDEVEAEPIKRNTDLGYYTNFMNLLDLSAIALPAGFRPNGLPFGITLCAPAFSDRLLLALARRREIARPHTLGTSRRYPAALEAAISYSKPEFTEVAVCGAHLSGMPLNHLLTDRGGRLIRTVRTQPLYRLYALPDGKRPGLVRRAGGASIEVEVWKLPTTAYGEFVAEIPAPLGIGWVELNDGSRVQGFLCEAYASEEARDITVFNSWRAYLARPS